MFEQLGEVEEEVEGKEQVEEEEEAVFQSGRRKRVRGMRWKMECLVRRN